MAKKKQRAVRKKTSEQTPPAGAETAAAAAGDSKAEIRAPRSRTVRQRAVDSPVKKQAVKKPEERSSVFSLFIRGSQFFKEAKVELKKVKWPTRKELLASTAVVIVLTLFVSFFLGLVDFGLIKIIRNIVG